ncbi:MAG: glycosyltransferase family 4 protein, partial [Lachnospiraceae bacterium]|nr:glycosyltransferase family 4 protein [Lachnospiraceae bacterium]
IELVGDGPYRKTLEAQTERLGLESFVTFRGWVDHGSAEHTELVRNAAIFVSASRWENCPVAVLEAAAAGSTLVLSDIPGHRSMMGDQALYFAADDTGELAEILRSEMGKEHGRKHYDIRAFSWETVVPLYVKLLEECAATAGHSRG